MRFNHTKDDSRGTASNLTNKSAAGANGWQLLHKTAVLLNNVGMKSLR
jgi:hypothetical protein